MALLNMTQLLQQYWCILSTTAVTDTIWFGRCITQSQRTQTNTYQQNAHNSFRCVIQQWIWNYCNKQKIRVKSVTSKFIFYLFMYLVLILNIHTCICNIMSAF